MVYCKQCTCSPLAINFSLSNSSSVGSNCIFSSVGTEAELFLIAVGESGFGSTEVVGESRPDFYKHIKAMQTKEIYLPTGLKLKESSAISLRCNLICKLLKEKGKSTFMQVSESHDYDVNRWEWSM